MARLLVLVALLGVMLALRLMRVEGTSAHDPLTLAAIGFVLMASYTAAEVGSEFKLPRVSGYIAAGVLLGPSVFDVLSARVVEEMTMFNTLALGLIATGAGLELELKSLGSLWRTLSVTVLGKIVLSGGLVFAAFYFAQTTLQPVELASAAQVVAVGLVLGTTAVGTSPAIVLAVINEMGAKGRVADLALGAAVIKDFVLVVLLAIAVAVSHGLLASGGHGEAGHGGIALVVSKELLGSIAVGMLVGGVIILYVRFVGSEMLLFVAALVLAVAEISRILHLDLLLVFIASGFAVRNFSKVWHEVLEALETVSLPVFVVFFTIAGARIDLAVTYQMLPLALLLTLVRALGFFGATRLGGWVGGDSAQTSNRAFLAYLPQAGVTLGLLGLAGESLPELKEALMAVGVACVAINLVVGPVTLRRSLQADAVDDPGSGDEGDEPDQAESLPVVDRGSGPQQPVHELDFGDPALREFALGLERDLRDVVDKTLREQMEVQAYDLTLQLADIVNAEQGHEVLSRLDLWARGEHGKELSMQAGQGAREFYERCERRLAMLPAEVVVECAQPLLHAAPGDSTRVRLRKLRVRLLSRVRRRYRERHVPVRLAARYALSPRMSMIALQVLGAMCRTHGRVLTELRRRACGDLTNEQLAAAATEHLESMSRDFKTDALCALGHAMVELADLLKDIDSPERRLNSLRFSTVEPEVRRHVELISVWPPAWDRALQAVEAGLGMATAIARVGEAAENALSKEVLEPLADAAEELAPAVAAARVQLQNMLSALQEGEVDEEMHSGHAKDLARLREQRDRDVSSQRHAFRAAAALHSASVELRHLVDSLPAQVRVPGQRDQICELVDPGDFPVRVVALRNEARRLLILELVPTVDVEGTRAAVAVQDLDMRRAETVDMVESAVEGAMSREVGPSELQDTIQRALDHLAQGERDTHGQLVAAHDRVAAQLTKGLAELSNLSALSARGVREALVFAKAPIAPLHKLRSVMKGSGVRLRGGLNKLRAQRARLLGAQFTQHLTAELRSVNDLAELLQPRHEALPVVYGRLFRLEPLRDLRLSAAREDELQALLAAERGWLAGGPSSALIVGNPGAGATTLLNLAQADFNAPRLIRPEAMGAPREMGLIRALAYEVRRRPTRKDVVAGLTGVKTVVVLEDLGHWLPAGAAVVPAVREFLDLVLRTYRDVFWVVTVKRQWVSLVDDVERVADVFGKVIDLSPLDVQGIRRVIETRHNLSGMPLVHNEGSVGRLLGRIREGSSADLEFRLLHSVCGGNLQAALSAWSRAVEVRDGAVHVHVHRLLLEQLPSLAGMEAPVIALLVHLVRYGPLDLRRLSESLGLGRQETQQYLRLLDNSGLLTRQGRQLVTLDPQHRWRLMPRLPLAANWRVRP